MLLLRQYANQFSNDSRKLFPEYSLTLLEETNTDNESNVRNRLLYFQFVFFKNMFFFLAEVLARASFAFLNFDIFLSRQMKNSLLNTCRFSW